jgi:oligosaccharyltransferase complex subunit beta
MKEAPIALGSDTLLTYTYVRTHEQPMKEAPIALGSETLLVAALQARNNARIIVTGSLDMFSNKAFNSQVSIYIYIYIYIRVYMHDMSM